MYSKIRVTWPAPFLDQLICQGPYFVQRDSFLEYRWYGQTVSMGVIPVDARSSVTISPEVQAGWDEGSVLAVTLEPQGGAPEGIPTGPIVAKGAVTRI